MRLQSRNQNSFVYKRYLSTENVVVDGYDTGEKEIIYSDPILAKGNIAPAKGAAQIEQFGTALNYDRVIICEPIAISENDVLYINTTVDQEPDYIVTRVAKSLNHMAIAVSKICQ